MTPTTTATKRLKRVIRFALLRVAAACVSLLPLRFASALGARFFFTHHLSLAPTISGIYGRTENEFKPRNPIGDAVKAAAAGTFVDWMLETRSVAPSLDLRYEWSWRRTTFEFSSRYNLFHTEREGSRARAYSGRGATSRAGSSSTARRGR